MTKTMSIIATLAASLAGREVILALEGAEPAKFTLTGVDAKLGKLNPKTEAEYLVLTSTTPAADGEEVTTVTLHPKVAKKLMEQGAADGYTMELPQAAADTNAEPEVPEEPKAPSKKELTVAMFGQMTAESKPRKDIIAALKADPAIQLSQAGANTYYQNCLNGPWKEAAEAATTAAKKAINKAKREAKKAGAGGGEADAADTQAPATA